MYNNTQANTIKEDNSTADVIQTNITILGMLVCIFAIIITFSKKIQQKIRKKSSKR